MRKYQDMLKHVLINGESKMDRTTTGTLSVFGYQVRFNLKNGFPLVTTKKLHVKSIIHELLWFLSGDTNIKYLNENGVTIWDEWADDTGNLGNVYGHQWRSWAGVDQVAGLIEEIKANPSSRRLILSAWNVGELEQMALPPCHCMAQFYVKEGKFLSCHMYQRSADVFLGVPFNIASYALLTEMIAQVTGLIADNLIISYGDLHLYNNHIRQAITQNTREPYKLPKVVLNPDVKDIFNFVYDDIKIKNYNHHPRIAGKVSI